MEHRLFKYIWRHSRREQIAILMIVLGSMPFYFLSLDLPKQIVNQGIQGEGFSGPGSTQSFLAFDLPFGDLLTGSPVRLFDGFQLEQSGLLIALSFTFLLLVIVNGMFKLVINTQKGRLGERMLRRLRYELTDRVLRFPLPHLRRMKQAEVATMIKDEVEPLGGFIGDAFITPVFLGGQALTALTFIMVQSVWLGMVALAIVLLQAWIIPRLRRRILALGKERQITARQLAGRVAEIMDGAVEIHSNDTSNWERADIVGRLGRIFHIRFEIYQRKFFVKFLNNLMSQMTPFIFYVVGGLLALNGEIDIGALVAVIAAYKDLPGPIKELIDWDQQRLDVQIKYTQVIEQFEPGEILDPERQSVETGPVPPLEGKLELASLTLMEEDGSRLLDNVSLEVPLDRHCAIVGDSASGKERLALILAALELPSGGSVRIGGRDLTTLPQSVTGRRLSYVGPDAYHFPQSVRENLLYGLRHAPLRELDEDRKARSLHRNEEEETRRADNPVLPLHFDWIDRGPLKGDDGEAELGALLAILRLVEMEDDIYRFGLYGTLDPQRDPDTAEGLLKARQRLREQLSEMEEHHQELVEQFDPARYGRHATVAENLLFGTPVTPDFRLENLARQPDLRRVLREQDLEQALARVGLSIAKTMIELFADLPPGHPFFEQFSFIDADQLPDYKALVQRSDKVGAEALSDADRQMLLQLSFGYVEARHRLDLIDEDLEARILAARRSFADALAEGQIVGVEPFDPERYNAAASILANVLFGRLVYGKADAETTVERLVASVLEELQLKRSVLAVGLDYNVGIAGKRLSATQRQKLALARALLKDPDLLIVNDALAVTDGATQRRLIAAVRSLREGRGIVWCLTRAASAEGFEQVVLLQNGRKTAEGSWEEMTAEGSPLAKLVAAG